MQRCVQARNNSHGEPRAGGRDDQVGRDAGQRNVESTKDTISHQPQTEEKNNQAVIMLSHLKPQRNLFTTKPFEIG